MHHPQRPSLPSIKDLLEKVHPTHTSLSGHRRHASEYTNLSSFAGQSSWMPSSMLGYADPVLHPFPVDVTPRSPVSNPRQTKHVSCIDQYALSKHDAAATSSNCTTSRPTTPRHAHVRSHSDITTMYPHDFTHLSANASSFSLPEEAVACDYRQSHAHDRIPSASRYRCPYCQKAFARPSSLRTHVYSHTGEKPFVCTEEDCGRRFSVQSNLRRHVRTHRQPTFSPTLLPPR